MAVTKFTLRINKLSGPTDVNGDSLLYIVTDRQLTPHRKSQVQQIEERKNILGGQQSGYIVQHWDGSYTEINGKYVETCDFEMIEDPS